MAKQILIGIEEQELSEIAHYLMIYFSYNHPSMHPYSCTFPRYMGNIS